MDGSMIAIHALTGRSCKTCWDFLEWSHPNELDSCCSKQDSALYIDYGGHWRWSSPKDVCRVDLLHRLAIFLWITRFMRSLKNHLGKRDVPISLGGLHRSHISRKMLLNSFNLSWVSVWSKMSPRSTSKSNYEAALRLNFLNIIINVRSPQTWPNEKIHWFTTHQSHKPPNDPPWTVHLSSCCTPFHCLKIILSLAVPPSTSPQSSTPGTSLSRSLFAILNLVSLE